MKQRLTSEMMTMTKKILPGERTKEQLTTMAKWAKEAGECCVSVSVCVWYIISGYPSVCVCTKSGDTYQGIQ